ncbi:zinc finger and SCAN domain-containing protein 31-like [Cyprinodon tularosa]|uniref:zinc finger and SCAN domain-containing protein 31-like n=1 Tax=Cyprinodon tularosa TaxID=77115 RepID=UPI0018E28551|nr:zinc finger and SCAN domain-containing protein 31-like [Cyprinodon tularosa]
MSSVQHLREFIRERLTAAAEEIFTEVEKTIIRYEEENRLMENCWKPQEKLQRIGIQKPHIFNEEETIAIQLFRNQRKRSNKDQDEAVPQWTEEDCKEPENPYSHIKKQGEPGPPWIKEEEEHQESSLIKEEKDEPEFSWAEVEHQEQDVLLKEKQNESGPPCYQEEEEPASPLLDIKKEPDYSLPKYEQWLPEHTLSTQYQEDLNSRQKEKQLFQKQSITFMETFNIQEVDLSEREPRTDQHSIDIFSAAETKEWEERSSTTSESQPQTDMEKMPLKCDICGRFFRNKSTMKQHYINHTGDKPFSCETCGKGFSRIRNLNDHIRTHTGEKTFPM